MRAARSVNMPHSLLRSGVDRGWTLTDRLLLLALTLHEDGLHSCGHPRSLAFEDFNEGIFEVREETCQACKARDLAVRDRDGKQLPPGLTLGVANTLRAGESFRLWDGTVEGRVKPNRGEGDAHDPDEHAGVRDVAGGHAAEGHEPEQD